MFKEELFRYVIFFTKIIPGLLGCKIRRFILPARVGKGSLIWDFVHIDAPSKLTMGINSSINRGCVLNCCGEIEIGDDVLVGPNVTIYSQNHNYLDKNQIISLQGYKKSKVIINNDVWVAASVVILPGVTLAQGSVIAAGAVVTKSTEEYAVYAGVPAKKIGERK